MSNRCNNFESGFTLVEILVGLSLIVITTLAVINLAAQNVRLSRFVLEEVQAGYFLEEGAEATRLIRDEDWVLLSALDTDTPYYLEFIDGSWSTTETPQNLGIFSRTVTFSQVERDGNDDIASSGSVDDQTLLVDIAVSWLSGGESKTKNLKFYITDFFAD